jgi:hypothetical protein
MVVAVDREAIMVILEQVMVVNPDPVEMEVKDQMVREAEAEVAVLEMVQVAGVAGVEAVSEVVRLAEVGILAIEAQMVEMAEMAEMAVE